MSHRGMSYPKGDRSTGSPLSGFARGRPGPRTMRIALEGARIGAHLGKHNLRQLLGDGDDQGFFDQQPNRDDFRSDRAPPIRASCCPLVVFEIGLLWRCIRCHRTQWPGTVIRSRRRQRSPPETESAQRGLRHPKAQLCLVIDGAGTNPILHDGRAHRFDRVGPLEGHRDHTIGHLKTDRSVANPTFGRRPVVTRRREASSVAVGRRRLACTGWCFRGLMS